LNACEDEQYLPIKEIVLLKDEGWRLRQLIDGYIRYLRIQKQTEGSSSTRETAPVYGDELDTIEDDPDSRISI
jgi:hypothetical protein